MRNPFSNWLDKNPLLLWLLIALFVGANIWYDCVNPGHAIIDGVMVILIVLVFVASRFQS